MRVIVADTAPLNYLVVIEAVGILPRLFASVLIPLAVKKELSHGHSFASSSPPDSGASTSKPVKPSFGRATAATACTSSSMAKYLLYAATLNAPERVLAKLKAGDCFGEMAIVADSLRMATAKTASAANLMTVDRDAFQALFRHLPPLRG